MRLTFWMASRVQLTGVSDADHTTCKYDSKNVAGYCFNYKRAAISWSSKKQACGATSSTEAELHDLSVATKEALHLQARLQTLGRPACATLSFHLDDSARLTTLCSNSRTYTHMTLLKRTSQRINIRYMFKERMCWIFLCIVDRCMSYVFCHLNDAEFRETL